MSRAGAIDIAILTGSHLCRNPRVVKEANALAEAGYAVSVLSVWTRKDWLQIDRTLLHPGIAYRGIDLTNWRRPKALWLRMVKRLAGELNRRLGIESVHSLNYGMPLLLRLAKKERARLYIGHQETGLALGCRLLKGKHKVAFDLEDWYSKDLLPEARRSRPVKLLEDLERQALHHGAFAVTTSGAMADEMGRYFQCPAPGVILNVFPRQETAFPRNGVSSLRLIWFSQTIGPGRGLEEMLDSISSLEDVALEIHLLGDVNPGYRSRLGELARHPGNHRLFFHPTVLPAELNHTLSQFDVGLALERPFPESRDLTITNKIVQYLQAGLAVLATDTRGQSELAAQAEGAVFLVDNDSPQSLAVEIRELAKSAGKLNQARQIAQKLSSTWLNWEGEKVKLLKLVERELGK